MHAALALLELQSNSFMPSDMLDVTVSMSCSQTVPMLSGMLEVTVSTVSCHQRNAVQAMQNIIRHDTTHKTHLFGVAKLHYMLCYAGSL